MSVFSLVEEVAASYPERGAVFFRGETITYRELLARSRAIASSLAAITPRGSVVGIFMEHSADWLVAYLGVLAGGFVALPLNARAADIGLREMLEKSRARVLLTSKFFAGRVSSIVNGLSVSVRTLAALPPDSVVASPPHAPDELMSIFFTSGTTGAQKAVMLSCRAALAATHNIVSCLGLADGERYYAFLPFYHSFGLGNVHATWAVGGTAMVSDAGTDLRQSLLDMAAMECTFFAAPPATLATVMAHFPAEMARAGATLRVLCTNTGPMPPEVTMEILAKLPRTQFFTYYGLTEASRSTFQHFNKSTGRLTSVGKPAPGVSIEIREGEVCIAGPHLTSGYLDNPALTNERLRNGWLRTGDQGFIDEEGYLFISGRNDDMVDIGGERFLLSEVDEFLKALPGIVDAASFLDDSGGRGDLVSCVVPVRGEDVIPETILVICRERLERHKVPHRIQIASEIPKTESGKVKRHLLKSMTPRQSSFREEQAQRLSFVPKASYPDLVVWSDWSRYIQKTGLADAIWVVSSHLLEPVRGKLQQALEHGRILECTGEPTRETITHITALLEQYPAATVVAMGGGSVIDAAKCAWWERGRRTQLIAIPSTPSSGAEVSPYALLVDPGTQKKILVSSPDLLPNIVVYDEGLLADFSLGQIGYFIFDILGHCIEGLASRMSSPVSDLKALEAIRILRATIPPLAESLDGRSVLGRLQYAGHLGGMVQGMASVGMAHALAHYAGGKFGIPHARSVALFLPGVVELNATKTDKYKKLEEIGLDVATLLAWFAEIKRNFGIADDMIEGSIDDLEEAMKNDFCAPTNPWRWSAEELKAIAVRHIRPPSIDTLLAAEPYDSAARGLFLPAMKEALRRQAEDSLMYRRFLGAQKCDPANIQRVEDIPFLPIAVFKEQEIVTGDPAMIKKRVFSSSTSGGKPSIICLDAVTIDRQRRALAKIMSTLLGSARVPLIVLDAPKTAESADGEVSSRGSAIRGFLPFATQTYFVLNDDLTINDSAWREALDHVGNGGAHYFFGFTWVVYKVMRQLQEPVYLSLRERLAGSGGAKKLLHIGGWKKLRDIAVEKDVFNQLVADELRMSPSDVIDIYGMTEQLGTIYPDCAAGYKHVPVYADVIVRRTTDFIPVPDGEDGLLQFLTPIPRSYPGISILTDDMGAIVGRDRCACGREGKRFVFKKRHEEAEMKGCGDTI